MLSALLGGVLIGFAATLYWVATGRVAGISGIVGGALRSGVARGQRLLFLTGLIGAGAIARAVGGVAPASHPRAIVTLILAGVLVGFGTRVGGGCTSGHGVCGISRLSPRSILATAIFVAMGALTVFVFGGVGGRAP